MVELCRQKDKEREYNYIDKKSLPQQITQLRKLDNNYSIEG